jgi:hypothetical protein
MDKIALDNMKRALHELSNRERQTTLWTSSGTPEVGSYSEAVEDLFGCGVSDALERGNTGFNKSTVLALIELRRAINAFRGYNRRAVSVINDPEMANIRKLAGATLDLVRTEPEDGGVHVLDSSGRDVVAQEMFLPVGHSRKARVWMKILPDAVFEPRTLIKQSFETSRKSFGYDRISAVEIMVSLGARDLYGLLGGTLSPGPKGKFDVQIAISGGSHHFADHFASSREDVRAGLTEEYAEAALYGVSSVGANLMPAGSMRINCAAWGGTGSSLMVFRHLGAFLMKVLCQPDETPTAEQLATMFPANFARDP